jgi:hypothetical protein
MKKYILTVKHDNGRIKLSTWAISEKSAKDIVCKAESCPEDAIIKVATPRLNIYDIARLSTEGSPYFFSRKTLRFFGQNMRSFSVVKQSDGRTRISAPMMDNGRHMGQTVRYFNPENNKLERE